MMMVFYEIFKFICLMEKKWNYKKKYFLYFSFLKIILIELLMNFYFIKFNGKVNIGLFLRYVLMFFFYK